MEVRQGHKSDSKQKQTVALHQGWKLGFRYILIINERLNHPVSFKDNNRNLFRSHKQTHTLGGMIPLVYLLINHNNIYCQC